MISSETIEEIKARASLIDVVSETVALKRSGGGFVGLCPFHGERSPSFHVRDNETYYHCFGCGKSGNVFSFVMETKGLTFPEAIEFLADRYGITVKREGSGKQRASGPPKADLYEVNRRASEWYQKNLLSGEPGVLAYLQERRITRDAVQAFLIGFAPRGNSLQSALSASIDTLIACGLCRRNDQGEPYDNLRARLVFPILIDEKRIAGFGGRLIPSFYPKERESIPKYLNSPETILYQKSKILYGLPQAFHAIREQGEVFVVEGYLDVIGLWQVGVRHVVATCGTSLTSAHVKRLSRLAKRATVLFDGDRAGRAAAARTFELFLKSPIDVNAVFLPEGEDPDSVAKSYGKETVAYLQSLPRKELIDVYIDSLIAEHDAGGGEKLSSHALSQVCRDVGAAISKAEDLILRDELLKKAARRLRISVEKLESGLVASSVSAKSYQPLKEMEVTDVTLLPRLDKEVLLAVMADRERFLPVVLAEPLLCNAVTAITLQFLSALRECERACQEETRDAVRALLRNFGTSWVAHWKVAFSMASQREIDFRRHIDNLLVEVQKKQLLSTAEKARIEAGVVASDEEKAQLLNDAVQLERRARALGEGVVSGK